MSENNASAGPIDWIGSLRSARCTVRGYTIDQLKFKTRRYYHQTLQIIAMDLSASTLSHQAFSLAKGLLSGGFTEAYRNRLHVALLGFQGDRVTWLYGPARPPKHSDSLLENLQAGGGTPLRRAIQAVSLQLEHYKRRWPLDNIQVYLITDGRSTDRVDDLRIGCQTYVIDVENTPVRLGRCRNIARQLGAEYLALHEIPQKDSKTT